MTDEAQRIMKCNNACGNLLMISREPGREEFDLVGGENLWSGGPTKQCLNSKPAQCCE